MQIIPDDYHWTIDVPNMAEPWNPLSYPAWKWLEAVWDLPISPKSVAITNLRALKGHKITEVMRWDMEELEMFSGAGPDVVKSDIRAVPFATLLGQDGSLESSVFLAIGSGLWRDSGSIQWNSWTQSSNPDL